MDDKQPARMSYELNYDSVDQAVNSFLNKREFLRVIFIIVLHRVWFRVKCLKQGIKNRNSV